MPLSPKLVHFTQGLEALACMSLSHRGLLRWYASCCNTPIGNTSRDFKTAYVGLTESCLRSGSPSLQESFGPVRMVLNTKSARGSVKSTPVSNLVALLGVMKSLIKLGRTAPTNPIPSLQQKRARQSRAPANLRRPSGCKSQVPPDLLRLSAGFCNRGLDTCLAALVFTGTCAALLACAVSPAARGENEFQLSFAAGSHG